MSDAIGRIEQMDAAERAHARSTGQPRQLIMDLMKGEIRRNEQRGAAIPPRLYIHYAADHAGREEFTVKKAEYRVTSPIRDPQDGDAAPPIARLPGEGGSSRSIIDPATFEWPKTSMCLSPAYPIRPTRSHRPHRVTPTGLRSRFMNPSTPQFEVQRYPRPIQDCVCGLGPVSPRQEDPNELSTG